MSISQEEIDDNNNWAARDWEEMTEDYNDMTDSDLSVEEFMDEWEKDPDDM